MADYKSVCFKPGDVIFKEGEPGKVMYILVQGAVDLKKKVDKGETVLKTVDTPNDFFGEMALVDDRPRSATAIAAKPTKLVVVDETIFDNLIMTNGKFALKVIKVLSERIRNSNYQITELIETGQKERIHRGMADYALRFGEKIFNGGQKVNIEEMKSWINSHLGIPKSDLDNHLYRLLKDETVSYAPTSVKTKDHVVLPEDFLKAFNRRA